jgi:hypothetical protein
MAGKKMFIYFTPAPDEKKKDPPELSMQSRGLAGMLLQVYCYCFVM